MHPLALRKLGTVFVTNNLLDSQIDMLTPEERRRFLWGLWRTQLEYAVSSETPAIKQILRENRLELSDFKNPDDLLDYPIATKRSFRRLGHGAFLPQKYRVGLKNGQRHLQDYERLHLFPRFTGGTSVRELSDYTLIRWSNSDWLGVMQSSTRGVRQANREILFPANAFCNYTFDHIAAPIFTGVVVYNGGSYVPRHTNLSDIDATKMLKAEGCDGIISPPSAHQNKGRSLVELLAGDSDIETPYLTGKNVRLALVSSTPLSSRVYRLFEQRGIVVKDAGGSTDIGAALWNCTEDPLRFHSIEGNVLNEVVDRKGHPVGSGERGLFVCSRIAGVVEADPFLQVLHRDIESACEGSHLGAEARRRLANVLGRDPLSMNADELSEARDGIRREHEGATRLVPNQATQVLRFSGLMNDTLYAAPEECACGKNTAKMQGLQRTYDFDGTPEDLTGPDVLEAQHAVEDSAISGFLYRLPDGCESVER